MTLLLCFIISFTISVVLLPVLVDISAKIGAVSEVGGRHVGILPIGRLGGVAVCLGIVSSFLFAFLYISDFSFQISDKYKEIEFVIFGWLLVTFVGLVDDVKRVPASIKFIVQIVGSGAVYLAGFRISVVDFPLIGEVSLGFFGLPITIFWVVGIVNAVNLIDGLDGLAGGVVLSAAVVNLVAALVFKSSISAVLMVSVVGAVSGFLIFNWYPAKIYLGDAGAYSLGYIVAVSALITPIQKISTGVSIFVPILALGFPIIDTTVTMARRLVDGSGIFSPDRFHLHHILLDSGISHKMVVIGLYLFSWVFCSIALIVVLQRQGLIGYCLFLVSVSSFLFWSVLVRNNLRTLCGNFFNRRRNLLK